MEVNWRNSITMSPVRPTGFLINEWSKWLVVCGRIPETKTSTFSRMIKRLKGFFTK